MTAAKTDGAKDSGTVKTADDASAKKEATADAGAVKKDESKTQEAPKKWMIFPLKIFDESDLSL